MAHKPAPQLALPPSERSLEHLNSDEAAQLLLHCERRTEESASPTSYGRHVAVSLALRLGLRRGEIFGLR